MSVKQAAVNQERVASVQNGWVMLVLFLALIALCVAAAIAYEPPIRVSDSVQEPGTRQFV